MNSTKPPLLPLLEWAALSDQGLRRTNNEDAWGVWTPGVNEGQPSALAHLPEQGLVFAVSDGMGGAAGGEVASRYCIDGLKRELGPATDATAMSGTITDDSRTDAATMSLTVPRSVAEPMRPWHRIEVDGAGDPLDGDWLVGGVALDWWREDAVSIEVSRPLRSARLHRCARASPPSSRAPEPTRSCCAARPTNPKRASGASN